MRVLHSYGGASCHIDLWNMRVGSIHVTCLETRPESLRRGNARALMTEICKFADRNKVMIELSCAPYSPTCEVPRIDINTLQKFYESLGFVVYDGYETDKISRPMKRLPNDKS